jgi:hypothetical protein
MYEVKRNEQRNATPVVTPMKRVSIGTDLENLQARLAELRRQTEVYPKAEPIVVTTDRTRPA